MSLGEIDTYNLTFDKLQALFTDTQGYYESFLDANNLYKSGQMSDQEFFQKLGDYTASYSALLFLGVNSLMELKKALDLLLLLWVHLLQLLHLMNQELYLHQILDYFHQNKGVEIVHHVVQN